MITLGEIFIIQYQIPYFPDSSSVIFFRLTPDNFTDQMETFG